MCIVAIINQWTGLLLDSQEMNRVVVLKHSCKHTVYARQPEVHLQISSCNRSEYHTPLVQGQTK